MKHKFIKMSALALAVSASCSVFAADGTAGATSVGSFTVQLGNTLSRAVRIWGLKDMSLLAGTTTDLASTDKPTTWTGASKGITDKFCVGDNTGGAVKITVTGAPVTDGTTSSLKAVNTVDSSSSQSFHMIIVPTSVTQADATHVVTKGASDFSVVVPATNIGTLTDLTLACTATNANVRKSLAIPGGAAGPATGTFTGVLTLTATPN